MQKGFTLLEVLVAVFILALMSLMIWQITNNTYRGTKKADVYNDIYRSGRISLGKLTDDISMAFLAGPSLAGKLSDGTSAIETSFIGEDRSDNDVLDFTSLSNVRLVKDKKEADQIEVGWFVADCPDSEEKIPCLTRRESHVIDRDTKEGGQVHPIARGVTKFNLEYYDPAKQEWRSDWNSKDPSLAGKLPRAARITLSFEELVFTTSVMLPLSGGVIEF